ncbi:MAG: Rab family GTPase [Candidatus Thorarchaeota archaeon]
MSKYVTILGDGAIGKTTLVKALNNQNIRTNEDPIKRTPFIEIESLKIEQEKMIIYDLAGQDNPAHPLKTLRDQVLGHAQILIFAFALDRFSSLAHLGSWYTNVLSYYSENNKTFPKMILVGTKADQPRKLDNHLIEKVLTSTKIKQYVATSSLTGTGISELKMKIKQLLQDSEEHKFSLKDENVLVTVALLS